MGHVQIFESFPAPPENTVRTLRVYTPTAYDDEPERRFGVVYLLDGQNVFDHEASAVYNTWCANPALEGLVQKGDIAPHILVAVDHLIERYEEYSPWPYPRLGLAGRTDEFARTLAGHIKPFIDQTFRTLVAPENTSIVGASLGALTALYLHREHPEILGRVGAMSPALAWCDFRTFQHWNGKRPGFSKIYLDAGEFERIWIDNLHLDIADLTPAFYRQLTGLGYGEADLKLVIEPGGRHHELDWQRRFPEMIRWLLA